MTGFKLQNLFFLIFCLVVFPNPILANGGVNSAENEEIVVEFYDKYKEVKLGMTRKTIYMEFGERVKNLNNDEFREQYEKESHTFDDSDGNFIMSKASILYSTKIEYDVDDIKDLYLKHGKLIVEYKNKPDISFEEILSVDGTPALENFYVEDLELLVVTYKKIHG